MKKGEKVKKCKYEKVKKLIEINNLPSATWFLSPKATNNIA